MAKTLENCKLIAKHGAIIVGGRCDGVAASYNNDEPPDECQRCKFLYSNEDEK